MGGEPDLIRPSLPARLLYACSAFDSEHPDQHHPPIDQSRSRSPLELHLALGVHGRQVRFSSQQITPRPLHDHGC